MNVLLVTLGSAGDVLPFCGIGKSLRERGHRVTLATNPYFAKHVESAGLSLRPLGDAAEFLQWLNDPRLADRTNGVRLVMQYASAMVQPVYDLVASERPDLVVLHPLAYGGRIAAERFAIAATSVYLAPGSLISRHDPPKIPGVFNPEFMPKTYRYQLAKLASQVLNRWIAPSVNACRGRAGLSTDWNIADVLYATDHPCIGLFPEWFAPPQIDWPQPFGLTGFPLYDDASTPLPNDVRRFIDAGTPPLVFAAGTGNRHAKESFLAAIKATEALGERAILLTAFAEQLPQTLPNGVAHFAYVPLSQLLPKAKAIVHHGGIGTSAAALAAGTPQLILPFSYDQPDNASRLEALGVALQLNPSRIKRGLAPALKRLLASPEVAQRCRAIAARLDGEAARQATAAAILDIGFATAELSQHA